MSFSPSPSHTVAIIGGGPQGLCALKNFLEEGFEATLFERRDQIGGLWAYSGDQNVPTVLQNTLGNVSKWKNCYSDFPIEQDAPVYLDQKQFLRYLEAYVESFELSRHIRTGVAARIHRRKEEYEGETDQLGWTLELKRLDQDGQEKSEAEYKHFNKVIIATGQYSIPAMPSIPGAELFGSRLIHSKHYKKPTDFNGKDVLIVGFGSTCADISTDLIGHAHSIHVAHRKGIIAFPRILHGKPIDMRANKRMTSIVAGMNAIAPVLTSNMIDKAVEKLSNSSFQFDPAWRFRPAPPRVSNRVMITDTFLPALSNGAITSVAAINRIINAETVELEDNTKLKVDAIICCTGYKADPSIVSNIQHELKPNDQTESSTGSSDLDFQRSNLYQNIFPPAHASSLAFLNNWQLGAGICEVTDLVSCALAQIWKGAYPLPSVSQMQSEIASHRRWLEAVLSDEPSAAIKTVQESRWRAWLHDAAGTGVNENLGYGLQGWMFWLREPRFCSLLMTGVDSPHITRLFDGKRKRWNEARKAIEDANREVEDKFGKTSMKTKDN